MNYLNRNVNVCKCKDVFPCYTNISHSSKFSDSEMLEEGVLTKLLFAVNICIISMLLSHCIFCFEIPRIWGESCWGFFRRDVPFCSTCYPELKAATSNHLWGCGWQSDDLPKQSLDSGYIILHSKAELRFQMELRLLISLSSSRKSIPDYPSGSNVITRILKPGRKSQRRCDNGYKARVIWYCFWRWRNQAVS